MPSIQPTKVLFLDFDGVLHPNAAYLIKGRPTLKTTGELFMWAPILAESLADMPDVQIVLSTSWARVLSFNRARRWLPPGLRERVIGATWHSGMAYKSDGFRDINFDTWWDTASRYQQIKRYVSHARLTHWVAVDDEADGWDDDDLDKLIHTNGNTGLSDPSTQALLQTRLAYIKKAAP